MVFLSGFINSSPQPQRSAVFSILLMRGKRGTEMLSNQPEGHTANRWQRQNVYSSGRIFLSPALNSDTVLCVQRQRSWGGLVGWEKHGEAVVLSVGGEEQLILSFFASR